MKLKFEGPCFFGNVEDLLFWNGMSANELRILVDHEFVYTFGIS